MTKFPTMTDLEQYIEQTIIPRYDAFDGGHRRNHAQMVISESLKLAREHGADVQMAYVIAAYHDLGLSIDREKHHIHSGEILMALNSERNVQGLETLRAIIRNEDQLRTLCLQWYEQNCKS